ncbi:MAG TPA: hypothetical protein PKY70_18540 [Nakamurella multipartita]|nr:hypothetical protein [Nakamurella multipartita]
MAPVTPPLPAGTPAEVAALAGREPRPPATDPTLGIAVDPDPGAEPAHRIVTIGDSLTHGFQSAAIYNTDLSYGAIIATELGWFEQFRYPRYPALGGLPLNLEYLLRELELRFGPRFSPWEVPLAALRTRSLMNDIEEYWERGPGALVPTIAGYNHALAVFSWDLYDALHHTFDSCRRYAAEPTNNLLIPFVDNAPARAALRVYPHGDPATERLTLLDVAEKLGQQGGIETLVVWLGANNVLGSVLQLQLRWSQDPGFRDPRTKAEYTVWDPAHFRLEYDELVARLTRIEAKNVILCTVPHVTIPPATRGVFTRPDKSAYFLYYARPWVTDEDFQPTGDKHLTAGQACAIDYAIDLYNAHIEQAVRAARQAGRNWFLCDIAGVLDRLAYRRYRQNDDARPSWWTPYPLPAALAAVQPEPDTQFLTGDGQGGRAKGGLFSLDGVHPTTVAYGIVAQELITIMQSAGVTFRTPTGAVRTGPIEVDFDRLIRRDTLLTAPPQLIDSTLGVIGWLDETIDVFSQLIRGRL